VIECDTPEGHGVDGIASLRALEAEHGALPATLMAESPSGSLHFYFTYPPGVVIRSVAGKIAPGVDQRGHGGMILAPPSVRPGAADPYRWLNENEIVDAPAWLIALATADEHKAKPKAKANGADDAPPPEFMRGHAASGRGTSTDKHDVVTREEIVAALRVIPADAEQVWFEVGVAIRQELGDDGRELFHAWSATSTKYVKDECEAKWASAAGNSGYTAGTIFHYADQASPGWRDDKPREEPKASAPPEQSKLDTLLSSAADLQHMTFDPLRWIVPEYLPEGLTVLAGKPKIGKSWLALDAAIAVASGGRCLGKQCEPGDVLALLLEDNQRRLQRRMTMMIGANKERWPARLRYATEWPRGDDGLTLMREWIAAVAVPRLIIVDVLQRIRAPANNRSRETQYSVEYEAMAALQKITAEVTGLAILVVHHQRKLAADDPLDTLSGTLGLTGAMDSGVILGTDDDGKFLYGRGRDLDEYNINVRQGADCRWQAGGPRGEPQPSTERARIIRALMVAGEPLSVEQIALAIGVVKRNIVNLLFKMHEDGAVIRTARGIYALPA
jgi:hypothetical protein